MKRCPECRRKISKCECEPEKNKSHLLKWIGISTAIAVVVVITALIPTEKNDKPKTLQEITLSAAEEFVSVWQPGISAKELAGRVVFVKPVELLVSRTKELFERDKRAILKIVLGGSLTQKLTRDIMGREIQRGIEEYEKFAYEKLTAGKRPAAATFHRGEILVNEDLVNNKVIAGLEKDFRRLLYHEFQHSVAATSSKFKNTKRRLPGGTIITGTGPGFKTITSGGQHIDSLDEGIPEKIKAETVIALARRRGDQGIIYGIVAEYDPFVRTINILTEGKMNVQKLQKLHQEGRIMEFIDAVGENEFEEALK